MLSPRILRTILLFNWRNMSAHVPTCPVAQSRWACWLYWARLEHAGGWGDGGNVGTDEHPLGERQRRRRDGDTGRVHPVRRRACHRRTAPHEYGGTPRPRRRGNHTGSRGVRGGGRGPDAPVSHRRERQFRPLARRQPPLSGTPGVRGGRPAGNHGRTGGDHRAVPASRHRPSTLRRRAGVPHRGTRRPGAGGTGHPLRRPGYGRLAHEPCP